MRREVLPPLIRVALVNSNYSWTVVISFHCSQQCLNCLFRCTGDIIHAPCGNLEPQHLKMLLSRLQSSHDPSERQQILLTLGNAAAFTVNQVQ